MWFKVDDHLHDHRKVRAAGLEAMGLWVLAGSWCGERQTDGFVPADILCRWTRRPVALAHRLVAAELWSEDVKDGEPGYRFHDWKSYQPTAAQVIELSEKRSRAGRRGNEVRWRR